MEVFINSLKSSGCEVEFGWKDKERQKSIEKALKKLKERGEDNKFEIAKKFYSYFLFFHNMDAINFFKITSGKDKYCVGLMREYLEVIVEEAKYCLDNVIKALGDDKPVEYLTKKILNNFFKESEDSEDSENSDMDVSSYETIPDHDDIDFIVDDGYDHDVDLDYIPIDSDSNSDSDSDSDIKSNLEKIKSDFYFDEVKVDYKKDCIKLTFLNSKDNIVILYVFFFQSLLDLMKNGLVN